MKTLKTLSKKYKVTAQYKARSVTSALESSREDLLSWISKKSRAFLEKIVTDIHKIKITYNSQNKGETWRGKHQLMLNIPFSSLTHRGISNYNLGQNGFDNYMSVSPDGVTIFYSNIPDYADIKHKGSTF